jgi:TolB protein
MTKEIVRWALLTTATCVSLLVLAIGAGHELPDDGILAFVSVNNGNREIALIDIDSTSQFNLTRNPSYDHLPHWLPDGETLTFSSFRDNRSGIYRLSIFSRQLAPLREDDLFEAVMDWSPDGQHVAFIRYYYTSPENEMLPGLYIMDTATQAMHTFGNLSIADAYSLRWSPDSRRIALISDHEGSPAIYLMANDGSNLKRVTQTQVSSGGGLSWSPSGEEIAFTGFGSEGYEIYTVDLIAGHTTQITHAPENTSAIHPSWSPDGSRIAYVEAPWGTDGGNLYVIDTDGSNAQLIVISAVFPVWRP